MNFYYLAKKGDPTVLGGFGYSDFKDVDGNLNYDPAVYELMGPFEDVIALPENYTLEYPKSIPEQLEALYDQLSLANQLKFWDTHTQVKEMSIAGKYDLAIAALQSMDLTNETGLNSIRNQSIALLQQEIALETPSG